VIRQFTLARVATALVTIGALTLTGCGGGGSAHSTSSLVPLPGNPSSAGRPTANATLSTTLPVHTSSVSGGGRSTLSATRSPEFIDTTTKNSVLVISVTPSDPAEAAQYGNLTICYPLYVNGAIAPNTTSPSFTTTTSAPGIVATVTLAFPAPPGQDVFTITQYAGSCGSTPFTIPTPPPGVLGSGILAQSTPQTAFIALGQPNALNAEIFACTTFLTGPPAQPPGTACPNSTPAPGAPAPAITVAVAVANIGFGTIPITSPVRESGTFLTTTAGTGRVGVVIPLEGLDAANVPIPGTPAAGSGPFPSGVTVSLTENGAANGGGQSLLQLVDATTGAIAQQGTSLTIHQFNALAGVPVAPSTLPTDITFGGSAAVAGDPYVIVLTYNGTDTTNLTSITVTAKATIPPATTATTISTTITPQSSVWTAGGTGYTDTANPTTVVGIIGTPTATYITDGPSLKMDGTPTFKTAAGAAALTGLSFVTWTNSTFVYTVDNGQTAGTSGTPVSSGVYAFDSLLVQAAVPVAAQEGPGNYIKFNKPVGIIAAAGPGGKQFLYVADGGAAGGLTRLDISQTGAPGIPDVVGGFQISTNTVPDVPPVPTGGLNFGTANYIQMLLDASGNILIPDPGNKSIDRFNPATGAFTAGGLVALGTAPFTGLVANGTGYLATSTTGQIYSINSTGVATSLGLTSAATAVDGPVGMLPSFTPATTPVLAPVNYALQFQANSVFNAASQPTTITAPYNLAPFTVGKIFAAAPAPAVGLIADTSSGATTGAGTVNATAGILLVAPTAAASNSVTPDSILFADKTGKLRTLVH